MALDLWGDFGFNSGANKTANPYQDSQECINYYPELSPSRESKVAVSLLGRPGLIQLAAPAGGGINSGSLTPPQAFANGDGSTTVFPTIDSNLSSEKVYVTDWQTQQLQYTTARTNLVTYSQDGTHWTAGNSTITANQAGAPDGTSTLNKIAQDNTNNLHQASSVGTSATIANGTYSARWIVKPGSGASYAECVLADQAGGNAIAIFSFITNSLVANPYSISSAGAGAWSNISTTSYAIGSGCFAIEMTATKGEGSAAIAQRFRHNNGTTDLFLGNASNYFYGWGMMLTQGTIIGSYIPTTTIAVSLTDYTISGGNTINFAIAPTAGSVISRQFFVTGNTNGLWPNPSNVTNLPVRGFWVLPGYTTALAIIGSTCYLVKQLTQGTTTVPGTISLTNVGTLSTFSGPVKMRDNNTSAGSSASVLIVDGQFGYTYGILTGTFAQINASGFTGFSNPSTVAYIDGWWIVGCTGSQQFFTNSPIYSNTWNATFFSLKDGASDNLVAVMENKEELWLLGERTSEIWYNAGAQNFAFQRLGGTLQQIGCKAPYSVSRFKVGSEDSLIWYGRSERGENVIVRTQGFNASVVSTNAVSDAIATYNTTNDAVGYCYEEDGHSFYVLTFPSADKTWVYDASLPPELAWHQRLSYDPYTNSFHRERPNAFMNFGGMRIVGDYQNGALYQMTRAAYTDAGWPILSRRRSPFIWDKENRRRVHMTELQVEFAPGQGVPAGTGSNPQARLRISRDYGTTYGEPIWQGIGKIGQFTNRAIWRKLGWTRGSVAEIEVIDPVNRDITGVTLRAFGE